MRAPATRCPARPASSDKDLGPAISAAIGLVCGAIGCYERQTTVVRAKERGSTGACCHTLRRDLAPITATLDGDGEILSKEVTVWGLTPLESMSSNHPLGGLKGETRLHFQLISRFCTTR